MSSATADQEQQPPNQRPDPSRSSGLSPPAKPGSGYTTTAPPIGDAAAKDSAVGAIPSQVECVAVPQRLRRTASPHSLASNSDGLWTAQDVADYLRMSVSFVYKEVAAERLPHKKIGSRVRFVPSAVMAYLDGM